MKRILYFLTICFINSASAQQTPPEIEWDKTFGVSDWDVARSIVSTPDGGYAVAGYTESKGAGDRDFWVLKLDANGNLLEKLPAIIKRR